MSVELALNGTVIARCARLYYRGSYCGRATYKCHLLPPPRAQRLKVTAAGGPAGAGLTHVRNLVHRGHDGHDELVGHGEEAAERDVQSSLDLGVAQGLLWGDIVGEVAVDRESRYQPGPLPWPPLPEAPDPELFT